MTRLLKIVAMARLKEGQNLAKCGVIFGLLALFVVNVLGQHVRYGPVGRGPDEKIPYSQ